MSLPSLQSSSMSDPDVEDVSLLVLVVALAARLARLLLQVELLDDFDRSTPGMKMYRPSRTATPPSRGGHDGARDGLLVQVMSVRSNTSAWPSKTALTAPPLPFILPSSRNAVRPYNLFAQWMPLYVVLGGTFFLNEAALITVSFGSTQQFTSKAS